MHPVERAFHHKLPVWYQGKEDKVLGIRNGFCILKSQGCLTWIPWSEVSTEAPRWKPKIYIDWDRYGDDLDDEGE